MGGPVCWALLVLLCAGLVGAPTPHRHMDAAPTPQRHMVAPCGPCTCNTAHTSANCSHRDLTSIPADLPANITHLDFARNRIRAADESRVGLCHQYPHLQKLSLAWNGMRTLSGLLHGCKRLEELDLAGNLLEIVHPTSFTDAENLQLITSMEVQELDGNMFHKLRQLETLHLTFHGLTMKPGVFRQLSSLRSLTVTLEKALRLPKHLFHFTEGNVLTQLSLKGSKVKDIPDDLFIELVSLKELRLDLPHVLQLRMNTNDRHKLLQVLEVSNVRSLAQDALSGLHALQVVILRGITHLAEHRLFQATAAVKELEIVRCSLTQLPLGWLDNMLTLETLNLSDNRLERLNPLDVMQLTALKHMVLSNNKIQELPAGVFSPMKDTLRQLLLNNNQLRQLPAETFTDMPMLEVLDLRRNMINNITVDSLRNLPRLQKLQLSGNYINSLGHVLFQSLPMLVELDLSENMISQFPDSLLASNVSQLDFSVNNLQQLPGEQLCHMGSLQRLVLEDNPVICDCSLRLLHRCLPRLLLSGTCSAPADVEGRNIEEVTECAPSISVLTTWSLWSPSLAALNSPVAFPLEPTPADLTSSHTWSPLLATTTLSPGSVTLLAAGAAAISLTAATPASPSPNFMTPTQSPRASLLSSRLPETLLISPSSRLPETLLISQSSRLPETKLISQSSLLPETLLISLSSSPELTPSISPNLRADIIMQTSVRSLLTSDKITLEITNQSLVLKPSPGTRTTSVTPVMPHVSSPSLMISTPPNSQLSHAGLTDSHDPMEDIDLNYDVYPGHEIVRPLVAVELSERDDPLTVTAGTDLSQSSVVVADFDWLNSSVVDTETDSFSTTEVQRAVTSVAPLPPDSHTEILSPRIGHVKAKPSVEESSGFLSVAGEITVAMFFSLVILLSILSGILLYRKYFHVGSYNATSPSTDLHPAHLIQMQPVMPNLTHSTTHGQ